MWQSVCHSGKSNAFCGLLQLRRDRDKSLAGGLLPLGVFVCGGRKTKLRCNYDLIRVGTNISGLE